MTVYATVEMDWNDSLTTDTFLLSPSTESLYVSEPEFTADEQYENLINNDSSITSDHNLMWAVYNLPSIIFLALNLIIGMVGNIMVIYVYGFRLKSTPMNSFVVSLAVVDIITCVIVMPLMILHDMLPYLFISNNTCKIIHFVYSSTIIASSLTLVTIAIDRYRRICRPLSNHLSVMQVRITTTLLVIVAATTCIPVIIMAGALKQRCRFVGFERKHCYLEPKYINSTFSEVFYSYKSIVILLTIIITVSCYFRIWSKSKVPSITGDLGGRRMSVRAASAQPKIKPNVKKMFMITLLFILSFLPSICVILVMMSMNIRDENLHPVSISFVNICRRTYLISSTLNPFICWYCNATFRLHVRYIISTWRTSDTSGNSISEQTSSRRNDSLHNIDLEKAT